MRSPPVEERVRSSAGPTRISTAHDPAEQQAEELAAAALLRAGPARSHRKASAAPPGSGYFAPPSVARPDVPLPGAVERRLGAPPSGGRPLDPSLADRLAEGLGAPPPPVRVHTGAAAQSLARDLGTKAFSVGEDLYFAAGAYQPGTTRGDRRIAHEVVHAAQAGPGSPVLRLDPATDAFVNNPPLASMAATMHGLVFTPATRGAGRFELPDMRRAPTAVALKRLTDTAYVPEMADRTQRDFTGSDRPANIVAPPGHAAALLGFLDAWRQERGDFRVHITADQRRMVMVSWALNPIPPAVWEVAQRIRRGESSSPREFGLLASQAAVRNGVLNLWWDRTQAYADAAFRWADARSPATLEAAGRELAALLRVLDPYEALLGAILTDPALAGTPGFVFLFPTRPDGARGWDAGELASFIRYSSSQSAELVRRATEEAAPRRSLLEGWVEFRGRQGFAEGDQPTTGTPPRANAPPIPSRMNSHPALQPPLFDAVQGSASHFTMHLRFTDIYEAVSDALGGWQYSWSVVRVPDDDLSRMQEALRRQGERPGVLANLRRGFEQDLRYGAEDLQRIAGISALDLAMPVAPGLGAETFVAANTILSFVGTAIMEGVVHPLTTGRDELRVPWNGPGLHVVRCVAGPRDSGRTDIPLFLRAPSVAWLPVWVRSGQEMAAIRTRQTRLGLSRGEERLAELERLLSASMSYPGRDADERERDALRLSLFGSTTALLEDQRRRLVAQQERLRSGRTRPEDRGLNADRLREQIQQVDTLLGMRRDRATSLGSHAVRLPATLVKDDGQTLNLLIEAADATPAPWFLDRRPAPRWFVSDLTTTSSGHKTAGPDPSLATDDPIHSAILNALKQLLESPSGYGRGWLSVWLPQASFDRPTAPPRTAGRERTVRIATDEVGIAIRTVENLTVVISIAAVAAAPFTGGSSLYILIPVGIIGAAPSAYRLLHRAGMGTLRLDLQTAMEVLDIVGALVGLGQVGAGLRAAATVGTRIGLRWALVEGALWITGLGVDGLSMLMMGAGMVQQIRALEHLPPGLRAARVAEIVGNAMVQLGIQAGGALASRAHAGRLQQSVGSMGEGGPQGPRLRQGADVHLDPVVSAEPGARSGRRQAPPQEHLDALPADVRRNTPVDVDPSLRAGTVRAEYRIGDNGRVDAGSIRLVAGPDTPPSVLRAHAETVRTLRAYAGVQGAILHGIDRVRGLLGGDTNPRQGTAAWEANLELGKLRAMVERRMERLRTVPVDDARAVDIALDIENLRAQLRRAEQIIRTGEGDPRGFIASEGRGTLAENNQRAQRPPYNQPAPPVGHDYIYRADTDTYHLRVREGHTGPPMMVVQRPDGPVITRRRTGAELNDWLAQQDGYRAPPPGHHYEAGGEGWVLRRDPGHQGDRMQVVRENGQWTWGPTDTSRPSFSDRQTSAALRVEQQHPGGRGLHPALESGMTQAGVPPAPDAAARQAGTPDQRAIVRQWSGLVAELDRQVAARPGENLRTGTETAATATGHLSAGFGEPAYGRFRRDLRAAAVEVIFSFEQTADGRRTSRRTAAEQRAIYDALVAQMPDNASAGALWQAYLETRSRLSADEGGFRGVGDLAFDTRRLQRPSSLSGGRDMDGALRLTGRSSGGRPPAGSYGLENKAGGSFDRGQCRAYSEHLEANGGRLVAGDGATYQGLVYFFSDYATAETAANWMRGQGIHGNIHVAYLGGPLPATGAGPPAGRAAPGEIGWIRR